ncbi:MAG: zinc ribbon domain-containing protein, partial [Lachnospiraceae bacterium]|nr:zinc ribbon domain-containing protein [Lachnospiraceae bacterium]
MKCPRCESEIPEGYMYCFKCGYAIQIVPDYDVDVEKSMDESRDRIAGSMGNMFNEGHAEETIEIPVVNTEVQAVRKTRIVLII